MRIAIVGAGGQLGQALLARLADRGVPMTRPGLEITDADSVRSSLEAANVDGVINAAAYNLVDAAESDPRVAVEVNALGARNIAATCETLELPLVHVSTDYVFGGDADRTLPYLENDLPAPVNAYGASKLFGEHLVQMTCCRSYIVRTCGLYGIPGANGKGNFVETIRRLAQEQPKLKVVNDQRCTPTSADALASAIVQLIETKEYGLYHATNRGDVSWYELACEVVKLLGFNVPVDPVLTGEFPRPARRPSYSVLCCDRLNTVIDESLPDWRVSLRTYIADRWGIPAERKVK